MNKKQMISGCLLIFLCIIFAGCGNNENTGTQFKSGYSYAEVSQPETSEEETTLEDLYLVQAIDTASETILLYSYKDKESYAYGYSLSTIFCDKYGNYTSVGKIRLGQAVMIDTMAKQQILSKLQVSDEVWEYDDITRFHIDTEKSMIEIADQKYFYQDDVKVFSDRLEASLDGITSDDTLRIIGKDKKILSVSVTTGHGNLALIHTELFEDSLMQLGNRIFVKVAPDMNMELPEGTYLLTVANNGWGGSQEITIERGKTTEVDLDSLKGEGYKKGEILFAIDNLEAEIYVDDEKIDYSRTILLRYGKHKLEVRLEGYENWARTLVVNSPEATIVIGVDELTKEGTTSTNGSETAENQSTEQTSSENQNSSDNQKPLSSETPSSSETKPSQTTQGDTIDTDYLKDYLTTLSQVILNIR